MSASQYSALKTLARRFRTQRRAVNWAKRQAGMCIAYVPRRGLITFWRDEYGRLCWHVQP